MNTPRVSVLSVYRSLLRHAKNLTSTQNKEATILKIKEEFRSRRNEVNSEAVQEMLKKAESSLSYLKMITPKIRTSQQQGYTRIVFGDGDNAKIPDKAVTNWNGKNMDPDSVKRHYRGLKRSGFKNNSHAKGLF